jgi:hypothetical protein
MTWPAKSNAFGRCGIGRLEHVGCLFRRGLHLLVGVLGLGDTAFREFTEGGGHLDFGHVEFGEFEFRHFKRSGRRLYLGFRGCTCGFRHGTRPCSLVWSEGCFSKMSFDVSWAV